MVTGRNTPSRLARLRRAWRARGRSGSAAIEFAMVAPVLFLFLMGIIETGVIYFAGTALQNATDDAARMVRTGQASAFTSAQFKNQICSELTGFISSATCTATLQIDVRQYATFSAATYPSVTNADGSLNAGSMSYPGSLSPCQVVLIRAFYPWNIMTPLMQPLLQNMPNGQYLLSAAAAFRSEPYTTNATC
ncbi:MAG TPA: TadE/TadG family type IV pilus assembly protein [Rhizomicrobium sp.]|nr:TadE/TadG family type IV pilus assembly protein [Rhizomicrobium sp.]